MDEVEKFVEHLRARAASERTVKTYLQFVNSFLDYLKKPASEATLEDVVSYLASLRDKSLHTQLIAAYSLRAFFKAVRAKLDPDSIPLPERAPEERKIVTIPEEDFKRAASSLPLKYAAMLAMTYEAGLRVSELCRLRVGDLDTREWTCYVRRCKGSISSYVPIVTPWVKDVLSSYVSSLKSADSNAPLFPGKGGRFMNYMAASTILKRALRQMGYPDARPHDIRHSRATHLWRAQLDPITIAKVLGHKQLSSTLRYAHVVVEDLRTRLIEKLYDRRT